MFRDKVDKNTRICDVYLVESYKKYNQMEYEEDTIICKCNIFWVNLFQIQDDACEQTARHCLKNAYIEITLV